MSNQTKSRLRVYGFLLFIIVVAASIHFMTPGSDASDNTTGTDQVQTAESADQPAAAADAETEKSGEESKKDAEKKDEEKVPVELAEATTGEISAFVTATANLRAFREVDVACRTDGIVEEVMVEEGDYVGEDQVLCELDSSQLQIQLQSGLQRLAQAKLQTEKARIRQEKAQVQIKNCKEELSRYQELYANKLVSETEVAQLQYRLEELEHDQRVSNSETRELTHRVDELESETEQIRLELARTSIRAPFEGTIIQRMVEPGRTARSMESLFKLADFSPLYADVFLSEAEARQVRPGHPAVISLGVDDSIQARGRIARISPVVDQATGTVKITIELLGNNPAFKPGAFVRVGITTETRPDAILIPKRAVMEEDGVKYVYVADGETAVKTEVVTGYKEYDQIQIMAGLSTGQQVVVAGQGALKDGARLQIVEVATPETTIHAANKGTLVGH
ncbi:MAG: efflux RND transporter periplasmic adaptor subunit [Acidobacteria bacterium]|nr:efflux RND transporter periplasmic adaptor subunit [Acidobacteriota bacterium]